MKIDLNNLDGFNQDMLDKLLEDAKPETEERILARRYAQNTIQILHERGIVGFDSQWKCYLKVREYGS